MAEHKHHFEENETYELADDVYLPAGQHLLVDIDQVDSTFLNDEERLAVAAAILPRYLAGRRVELDDARASRRWVLAKKERITIGQPEIVEQQEDEIVCRKTFHEDEFFFQGHYPGNPIVPGVILCEAAMQTGAILLSQQIQQSEGIPVATRLNDVK